MMANINCALAVCCLGPNLFTFAIFNSNPMRYDSPHHPPFTEAKTDLGRVARGTSAPRLASKVPNSWAESFLHKFRPP